jgi:hypothetical protein
LAGLFYKRVTYACRQYLGNCPGSVSAQGENGFKKANQFVHGKTHLSAQGHGSVAPTVLQALTASK